MIRNRLMHAVNSFRQRGDSSRLVPLRPPFSRDKSTSRNDPHTREIIHCAYCKTLTPVHFSSHVHDREGGVREIPRAMTLCRQCSHISYYWITETEPVRGLSVVLGNADHWVLGDAKWKWMKEEWKWVKEGEKKEKESESKELMDLSIPQIEKHLIEKSETQESEKQKQLNDFNQTVMEMLELVDLETRKKKEQSKGMKETPMPKREQAKGMKETPTPMPKKEQAKGRKEIPTPTPKELKDELDKVVVGQEKAKKILCVAVYNHHVRMRKGMESVIMKKKNVLLMGPTGTGKTFLVQTLAQLIDVPFVIVDATKLSPPGLRGEPIDSIVHKLIRAADFNLEAAKQGIVYIDEMDKIATGGTEISQFGKAVQQALLKLVEGTVVSVPNDEQLSSLGDLSLRDNKQIDTKDILFICGGAFVGIDKIISKRRQDSRDSVYGFMDPRDPIFGFTNHPFPPNTGLTVAASLEDVESGDLISYGLIPEFVGRFPVLGTLSALVEDQLIQILTKEKDGLCDQYKAFFSLNNVKLVFTESAIRLIAKKAVKKNTGVRGLSSILEDILLEAMYEAPSAPKLGEDLIATVDEESVGLLDFRGCGAKLSWMRS